MLIMSKITWEAYASSARESATGAGSAEQHLGGVFIVRAPRGASHSTTSVAITRTAAVVDTAAWSSAGNLATIVVIYLSMLRHPTTSQKKCTLFFGEGGGVVYLSPPPRILSSSVPHMDSYVFRPMVPLVERWLCTQKQIKC